MQKRVPVLLMLVGEVEWGLNLEKCPSGEVPSDGLSDGSTDDAQRLGRKFGLRALVCAFTGLFPGSAKQHRRLQL